MRPRPSFWATRAPILCSSSRPDPRYRRVGKLASTLHRTRPAEFLVALKSAVRELPAQERSVGRAYALGYVCHYLLDSTVHPLIISQVNALCAAGVEASRPRTPMRCTPLSRPSWTSLC